MDGCEDHRQRFQELIDECNSLLATMDTLQLNTLIERFSAEIDSGRTLNYLVDGPSLLTCLITRSVVTPDNLSALAAMAEVAHRSDLKRNIDHFNYSPSLTSLPDCPSLIDDGICHQLLFSFQKCLIVHLSDLFRQVFELVSTSIHNDWRNLARQLGVMEYQITQIYASTREPQLATLQVNPNLKSSNILKIIKCKS